MFNKEKAEELIAQYWRDGTVMGSDLANELQAAINHIDAITPKAIEPIGPLHGPRHPHADVKGCACHWCVKK
jgi:hypothetical protein